MKRYAEFEKFSAFRRPDWRWQRVECLAQQLPPGRCSPRDDDWIRRGRNFLCRWSQASEEQREQISWEPPGLEYAYQIHERRTMTPGPSLCIEARLLAGQSLEYIANEASTLPETVRWYEALFFNVLDRLQNRDWITSAILVPPFMTGDGGDENATAPRRRPNAVVHVALPFLDASLKYFAYFGGSILVDIMIHGIQSGRPLSSRDDIARWLDETWSIIIRRRSLQAAAQVEINKTNVAKLMATHARIMQIEKSDDTQENRRSAIERHIKALLDDLPGQVGPRPNT